MLTDASVKFSSTRMSQKIVDRGMKKPCTIRSAFNALREKEYMDTGMAHATVEAGTGKGTLHGYFASKEELLPATIETMILLYQDSRFNIPY